MRHGPHYHPCQCCQQPVECDGEPEWNPDGFPTTLCRAYHLPLGNLADVLCEDCASAVCECGEPATLRWDEGADFAFWTGEPRYRHVCSDCFNDLDNAEPPEPDGEAFRGNEAAAYAREQMDAARKLK